MTTLNDEDLKKVNGGIDITSTLEEKLGMSLSEAKTFFASVLTAAKNDGLTNEATLFENLLSNGDADIMKYISGAYTNAFNALKDYAQKKGYTDVYNKLNSLDL